MSIRVRVPNVGLEGTVHGVVVTSAAALVRAGDRVDVRIDTSKRDRGVMICGDHEYPVGNIHFLADESDSHHTLMEFELAD